jgi:uncharacterized protein YndB with AHSA1/START domain
MAKGTVRLHRVLRAKPERVYQAFLDAAALAKWLPPYGFTCTVDRLEAKVGGGYHASFTNFGTGNSHSFGGTYRELVPGEKLVYTDGFDDPNMPGEMNFTVVQDGIPESIPETMCYLGWQESLMQLAKLVEPEIPDN